MFIIRIKMEHLNRTSSVVIVSELRILGDHILWSLFCLNYKSWPWLLIYAEGSLMYDPRGYLLDHHSGQDWNNIINDNLTVHLWPFILHDPNFQSTLYSSSNDQGVACHFLVNTYKVTKIGSCRLNSYNCI